MDGVEVERVGWDSREVRLWLRGARLMENGQCRERLRADARSLLLPLYRLDETFMSVRERQ